MALGLGNAPSSGVLEAPLDPCPAQHLLTNFLPILMLLTTQLTSNYIIGLSGQAVNRFFVRCSVFLAAEHKVLFD